MDSSVPMILPKGIVINTLNIYKEVASYPLIPADKIWEYWHVYTTTNKNLKDPTARRLENFWWQVWGSDRRYLSGRALARIYEDISVGPTFVPLHGPPNRWEGPNVPALTKELIVAHLHSEVDSTQDRPNAPRLKSNDASIRRLSSSASKPPPSHPILKKSRSPLATGLRPTARFVSPPESGDEGAKESDIPSSGSTATTGLEMHTRSAKLSSATQRLIAVSTSSSTVTTSTNHPTSSRKCSAQASAAVPSNIPEDPPPEESRSDQTQLRAYPPTLERLASGTKHELGEMEDNISTKSSPQPRLSAKAAGKQPVASTTTANEMSRMSNGSSRPTLSTSMANSISLARNTSELRSPISARSISLTRTETDNSSTTGSVTDSSAMMGRSITQNGYVRKNSTQGLFTGATATTTNVAAHGQIIDQAGSLPASHILDPQRDGTSLASHASVTSMVDSRMEPTQPSHAASVPMGRTRSQLTLLLERENSRVKDKSRFRS
ncbi:hypothetical protein EsHS_00005963 [Epichloe bromicola]